MWQLVGVFRLFCKFVPIHETAFANLQFLSAVKQQRTKQKRITREEEVSEEPTDVRITSCVDKSPSRGFLIPK